MLIIAPNELFDKKIIIMPPRLQIVQRAPEQIIIIELSPKDANVIEGVGIKT